MVKWQLKHAQLLCMKADSCVSASDDLHWAIFTFAPSTFDTAPLAAIEFINKRRIVAKIG